MKEAESVRLVQHIESTAEKMLKSGKERTHDELIQEAKSVEEFPT